MFHKCLLAILILVTSLFLLSEKKRFDKVEEAKNHQVYSLISKKDNVVVVEDYYIDQSGEIVWL